jgi:hypothetical protein
MENSVPARTHGEIRKIDGKRTPSPEYRSWQTMKNRCSNPRARDWAYYGGRGITVCKEWIDSFETFLRDMGRRPSPTHTLDRIDGDSGYCAANCRWATRRTQARNRAYTRDVTWVGVTLKVWQWAERLHVRASTIHHYLWRMSKGRMTEADVAHRVRYADQYGTLAGFRMN